MFKDTENKDGFSLFDDLFLVLLFRFCFPKKIFRLPFSFSIFWRILFSPLFSKEHFLGFFSLNLLALVLEDKDFEPNDFVKDPIGSSWKDLSLSFYEWVFFFDLVSALMIWSFSYLLHVKDEKRREQKNRIQRTFQWKRHIPAREHTLVIFWWRTLIVTGDQVPTHAGT